MREWRDQNVVFFFQVASCARSLLSFHPQFNSRVLACRVVELVRMRIYIIRVERQTGWRKEFSEPWPDFRAMNWNLLVFFSVLRWSSRPVATWIDDFVYLTELEHLLALFFRQDYISNKNSLNLMMQKSINFLQMNVPHKFMAIFHSIRTAEVGGRKSARRRRSKWMSVPG